MSQYVLNPDDPAYPFKNQTNFTDPNLDPYGKPLGASRINPYVEGGMGGEQTPIMMPEVLTTAKRPAWQKAYKKGQKFLNQSKTFLKSAWDKVSERNDVTPTSQELTTTDMTNFKMDIVADTLAGTGHKNQEFSLKKSNLNPRQGLMKNSLLGQGYGGAGGYKV